MKWALDPGWRKTPVRWRHRLPDQSAATDAGLFPLLHRVRILSSCRDKEHPPRSKPSSFATLASALLTSRTSRTRFLIMAALVCHLLVAPWLVTSRLLSSIFLGTRLI